MRFLKIVLAAFVAALALLASLFIGAVAVIASIVLSIFRHSRTRQGSGETVPSSHPAEARRTKTPRDFDVIDVTATEVPTDPAGR